MARRALDYLVGFNLSPVLWRKLPGARSAGRVQSVCLRLIVEREMEIEAFNPQEYWSVRANLTTPRGQSFEARLTVLGGEKLDLTKISIPTYLQSSREDHISPFNSVYKATKLFSGPMRFIVAGSGMQRGADLDLVG